VLYQGDEIGLGDVPVAERDLRDPLGVRYWPAYKGRDPMRTPMHWRRAPGAGFTRPGQRTWLPIGDTACNAEDQRDDPGSMLRLARDLIALRAQTPDLRSGAYSSIAGAEHLWAWRRGHRHVVCVNAGDGAATVPGTRGRICIGTDRERDGEVVSGSLVVGPWQAAIVELD
jgi:alpha-glucosidase